MKSLCYDFPIRRDALAQVVVPRDLTKEEADRLCAFVLSLAAPEREGSLPDRANPARDESPKAIEPDPKGRAQ